MLIKFWFLFLVVVLLEILSVLLLSLVSCLYLIVFNSFCKNYFILSMNKIVFCKDIFILYKLF